MALFQIHEKVLEVRDRLISLVINGNKASRCVLAAWLGWCLIGKLLALLWSVAILHHSKVSSLKDVILGRSFGKVLGTLRWSSGWKDLCMVSILFWKTDAKPSSSDASEPGGIVFPQVL